MAFTAAQLSELEEAIALGATTVKHGDKVVTYASLDDMLSLRDRIRRELGLLAERPSVGFVRFRRGGS